MPVQHPIKQKKRPTEEDQMSHLNYTQHNLYPVRHELNDLVQAIRNYQIEELSATAREDADLFEDILSAVLNYTPGDDDEDTPEKIIEIFAKWLGERAGE